MAGNKAVNFAIGLIMIAYVGIEGVRAIFDMNTTNITGTSLSLLTVVLPIVAVIGLILMVIPKGR